MIFSVEQRRLSFAYNKYLPVEYSRLAVTGIYKYYNVLKCVYCNFEYDLVNRDHRTIISNVDYLHRYVNKCYGVKGYIDYNLLNKFGYRFFIDARNYMKDNIISVYRQYHIINNNFDNEDNFSSFHWLSQYNDRVSKLPSHGFKYHRDGTIKCSSCKLKFDINDEIFMHDIDWNHALHSIECKYLSKKYGIEFVLYVKLWESGLLFNENIQQEIQNELQCNPSGYWNKYKNILRLRGNKKNNTLINECPVCMENNIDHVLSCGHGFCERCVNNLQNCAICRNNINHDNKICNYCGINRKNKIKLYIH